MSVPAISSFTGAHHFLSNGFEGYPFEMKVALEGSSAQGYYYSTGEHAYQAAKAMTWKDHGYVASARAPFGRDGAKRRGRSIVAWPDWEARKYDAMRDVLAAKFAVGTPLARMLLDTGDALLVEGNDWGDRCWGVVCGEGRNWLGTLLMAHRALLRGVS